MAWQETLQRILSSNETFRLTVEESVELYNDAPLHRLMTAAHHRRCLHNPSNEVTYLVDRNINYTNVCTINCQFCSFYRPPGHEETYTQSYDEIHNRIHELEAIGGSRILMQGGVNPDLEFSWYIDLIKALRERHPTIDLDCFSPIEIEGISEVTELPTQTVLKHLKDAGMHGLPGGGAEMLVESVRKDVSPKKGHPDNWLRVMKEAQLLGLTTSATNVIGFGESNADRVHHLQRIREQQEEIHSLGLPGFTSFIAWPVQLETNTFGKRNRGQNKFERGAGST
ncbi:MAG: radical SAM protein, partial [Candidatus Thermoplasmatota archaeon]|nr:radical SAM protein [Candidatus Thermoplasmatota archaeon]